MIKAVIFDYFGVLTTDPYLSWLRHNPDVLSAHAKEIEDLSKAQDLGLEADEFFLRLAGIAGMPVETVRSEFTTKFVTHTGLVDYIRQLRRAGLKTAILSNSGRWLYDEVAKHALDPLFDAVLCSEEAGAVKPDPEIFHQILHRLDLEPPEAVFIDDRDYNVRGAEAVGMDGILYTDLAELRNEMAKRGIVTASAG